MGHIRKPAGILFAALSLFALDQHAQASTISYSYSASFDLLNSTSQSFSVQGFNPSLGSLSAIDFTYTFSTRHTFAGADGIDHFRIDDATAILDTLTFTTPGGETTTQSGQFGVPTADFGDYESTQPVALSGTPFVRCGSCIVYTANFSGQVTYTYAPTVASAPEVTTFVLAGAGLLGLGLLRRIACPAPDK
jgi:hypothetical protein